ncbi:Crp/Fnr family transcriptional regulator [Microvirga sp. 0TCS3.31]
MIVRLQQSQVLCEAGQPLYDAYFPHNVIISLMAVMHDGRTAEMSVFGSEGVTGLTGSAITHQAFGHHVVQLTGTASRIKIAKMHEVISTRPAIQRLMRHFMEALMSRVLQNVACNAIHSVEARCARLILSTSHRVDQEIIPLTHESWADRLGTERSTVSAIMKKFDTAGWIKQGRGGITITDRMLSKKSRVNAIRRFMTCSCACCPTPLSGAEDTALCLTHHRLLLSVLSQTHW